MLFMSNILVIGNGFDLEHEIPSSYKNFLDFTRLIIGNISAFKENNEVGLRLRNSVFNELGKISTSYVNVLNLDGEHITYIHEFYQLTKHNLWIEYFQSCLTIRERLGKEFNWIDLEKEISNIIKVFSADITLNNKVVSNKIQAQKTMRKTGREIPISQIVDALRKKYEENTVRHDIPSRNDSWNLYKSWMYNDFLACIRALEIYFDKFIDYSKIQPKLKLNEFVFDKVVSFNYTNTPAKCYDSFSVESIEHIHGFADCKREKTKNNMVLGIDEFLDGNVAEKDIDLVVYRKYFQRIIKKCDFSYRNFIKEAEDGVTTFFFGHSMAASDKDVLLHLLPDTQSFNSEIKSSYIFYHSQQAYNQQVMNLIDILGHDTLNELVYDGKIHFIEQSNLSETLDECNLQKW